MDEHRKCPLGENCDLTVAWMAGYEEAKGAIRHAKNTLEIEREQAARARDEGWNAAIDAAAKSVRGWAKQYVNKHVAAGAVLRLKKGPRT